MKVASRDLHMGFSLEKFGFYGEMMLTGENGKLNAQKAVISCH